MDEWNTSSNVLDSVSSSTVKCSVSFPGHAAQQSIRWKFFSSPRRKWKRWIFTTVGVPPWRAARTPLLTAGLCTRVRWIGGGGREGRAITLARITRPFQRESSKRTERRPRCKLENEKISREPSEVVEGEGGRRKKKLHHQRLWGGRVTESGTHRENVKFFGKASNESVQFERSICAPENKHFSWTPLTSWPFLGGPRRILVFPCSLRIYRISVEICTDVFVEDLSKIFSLLRESLNVISFYLFIYFSFLLEKYSWKYIDICAIFSKSYFYFLLYNIAESYLRSIVNIENIYDKMKASWINETNYLYL